MTKTNAYIKGTGSYVPPKILKNEFFEAVGSSDEWIFKNLGIRERRIAVGEVTSDLAYKAGLKALEGTDVKPEDINLIIEIELKKLYDRIKELGYQLKLSDKAKAFIADKGFDKQFGARPLKRAIQKYVEDTLAEEIITSKIASGDEIFMDIVDGSQELTVNIHKAEEPTNQAEEPTNQ